MWQQKQNNELFSDRVMGPRDGNSIVPAPSDVSDRGFLSESSRKRKSMVMDYPANAMSVAASQSVLGSNLLKESKHQDKSDVLSSMHEQGNTKRDLSSPSPCFESGNMFQSVRYQDQNYSLTPHMNKQNVHVAIADKLSKFHSSMQQGTFHQKGLANMMNLPAGSMPNLPDLQSTPGKFLSEIEAHKHPYPDQTGTSMENTFSVLSSLGSSFGNINHIFDVNSSTDMCAKTTKLLSSSAVSLNNRVSDHDVKFDGKIHNEDTLKTGPSLELKLTEQRSYGGRTKGICTVGTRSLETAHSEGNVTEQSCQSYNTEAISTTTGDNGVNSEQKLTDDYGKNDTQIMARKEGSVMEYGNDSTGEGNAENSTYVLAGHGHGQDSQYGACAMDGKSKSHSETATSVTEKLWEGSIQLSTSVATSAVAFFKSGEKAPEITWSKSIAVKGKVRLEAFERFIQELPRSRSRGLMVISLRWMVGSSTTGLEGMKQVAKGYKEGNKVGYARVSQTVDLYVCPRTDTIITILAKYGFFKGMAALEGDQDSLIGCVVWRRNQPSSDFTPKKSKNKTVPSSEQPLHSAPCCATIKSDDTPVTRPGERVSPLKAEATVGISESQSIQLNEVQTEAMNHTSHNRTVKTHPVPHSSPVMPKGLNSYSQNNHTSSEAATPIIQSRGVEKPQAGLEIPRPVHPASPRNVTRENRPLAVDDDDNDDLPEFDFGAACGIVRHSVCKSPTISGNVSDSVHLGITVSAERANSTGGHMPSTLPAVQPTVIANQQRSQTITAPIVSCGTQPSNPAIDEGKPLRSVMSSSDEKAIARDSERTVTTSTGLPARKNLWDDDDMPEWCPPDLEGQGRPTTVSTTLPSVPCVPSPVLNPKPDNILPGPPPPPPPQPPAKAAATRPSNSYMPVPVPSWKPENLIPGPPPMTNPRPPSLHLSSADPNRKSENILPGPPPVRAASRPSFSYIASPMPNRNSENTLPRPHLPPPPPPLMSYNSHPQSRPVSVQPPIGQSLSMGFTYISAPRPQANNFSTRPPVRPPGWRGWQS